MTSNGGGGVGGEVSIDMDSVQRNQQDQMLMLQQQVQNILTECIYLCMCCVFIGKYASTPYLDWPTF